MRRSIPIIAESVKIEQGMLLDLWEFDLRPLGGGLLRYCNFANAKGEAVVWKGQTYLQHPIRADGFEISAQGAGSRPRLAVANLFGLITGLAEQYGQFLNVSVVRRQVYERFLDAANFSDGNPSADPLQEVVSKYVVERLASLTWEEAVLELAAPFETDGAVIPARIMLAGTCPWQYRGEECGYRGRPVADRLDMPTDNPNVDYCSGTLLGCRARFGSTAVLPFGGFPSVDKVSS